MFYNRSAVRPGGCFLKPTVCPLGCSSHERIPSHSPHPPFHQPSHIFHHPSDILHHPSDILHHPSDILHHPSDILHLPSNIFPLPSSIIHRYSPSLLRCVSSRTAPRPPPDAPSVSLFRCPFGYGITPFLNRFSLSPIFLFMK